MQEPILGLQYTKLAVGEPAAATSWMQRASDFGSNVWDTVKGWAGFDKAKPAAAAQNNAKSKSKKGKPSIVKSRIPQMAPKGGVYTRPAVPVAQPQVAQPPVDSQTGQQQQLRESESRDLDTQAKQRAQGLNPGPRAASRFFTRPDMGGQSPNAWESATRLHDQNARLSGKGGYSGSDGMSMEGFTDAMWERNPQEAQSSAEKYRDPYTSVNIRPYNFNGSSSGKATFTPTSDEQTSRLNAMESKQHKATQDVHSTSLTEMPNAPKAAQRQGDTETSLRAQGVAEDGPQGWRYDEVRRKAKLPAPAATQQVGAQGVNPNLYNSNDRNYAPPQAVTAPPAPASIPIPMSEVNTPTNGMRTPPPRKPARNTAPAAQTPSFVPKFTSYQMGQNK